MLTCGIVLSQSETFLRVKPGSHYFTDRSDRPFFWLGDTQWELFHQLPVNDAKKLLLERKKQGFTVVQCMTTGVFPEWGMMKKLKLDSSNEAWVYRDPGKPNEQYFRRMDSIIDYASEINMILVVGVYHAQDVDNGRITRTNARTWAKWLANRYRNASHVVWSMYPHADALSKDILNEVINGIQESDGGSHLITVHPDPSPKSSSFFYPAPWLSFNTLQTWNSGYINYSMVLADYQITPALPVVNGEARYEEEDGTTPFETRRAGYFSMLAGGFYSYGHQDNWRSARTWKSWYASTGARQMKIMSNIFQKISWWKLAPDSTILSNTGQDNVAARSKDDDWLIVYLSAPRTIEMNRKYLNLLNHSEITWINPETGKSLKAAFHASRDEISFTPPGWTDAVLLVRKTKK
jgi:hypothetical protein